MAEENWKDKFLRNWDDFLNVVKEKQQNGFLGKWDVFFIALMLVTLYYLFFINSDDGLKIVGSLFISLGYLIILWLKSKDFSPAIKASGITKIVLLTGDGEKEKEWYVKDAPSLLIGKNFQTSGAVDIDLADNQYADYIDTEHAVINRVDEFWYLEDLDSANGVGIKRYGTSSNFRIKPGKSYKLDIDDIIYIAKIRLIVK